MLRSLMIGTALFLAAPALAKDLPPLADLAFQSWHTMEPGRGTVCADGSPYRFYVKPGSSEKLLLFFNGGGACWSAETCDPKIKRAVPVYVPSTSPPYNDPRKGGGIFDDTRADNPFRDWSAVFVSYCTGDVHIGARRVGYGAGTAKFAIEHKGYVNAMAALRWTFRNYPSAKTILVAGSSAGAVAAPFFAGAVAKHYPAARISVLADAAGAYRARALPAIFRNWGVEDIAPKWIRARGALPLNIETFFKVNATAFPKIPQAQYNAVADAVQSLFLKLLGEAPDAEPALRANLAELERDIPTFRTYLAAGTSHTALRDERFFATRVEGVPLWRWAGDVADHRSVEDIDCADDAKGCVAAAE